MTSLILPGRSTPVVFSPQQEAVVEWVRDGSGSAFVEAVAGSGKTTVLIGALAQTYGSVAFCAYNRAIADEIKAKVAPMGLGNRVRVGTFHSFGLKGWRNVYPSVKVATKGEKTDMTVAKFREAGIPKRFDGFVLKLVSLAKQRAVGLFGDIDDRKVWYDIVEHFDLMYELEDDNGQEQTSLTDAAAVEFYQTSSDDAVAEGIEHAIRTLKYHRALGPRIVDFDDMIYLPVVSGIRMWQNQWLFGDEAQDTNSARRALARKMLARGGRALWVGDTAQAIYGFCHPKGELILTPSGRRPIETLKVGDPVVVFSTSGDVSGWKGNKRVTAIHRYNNRFGKFLQLTVNGKVTTVTPHHRIPAKIGTNPCWYVYMMERSGAMRIGHTASHATAGEGERRFLFSQRCKLEKADRGWVLAEFNSKDEAIAHETKLIERGVTGSTFHNLSDDELSVFISVKSSAQAGAILAEHGKYFDFPIWRSDRRQHFEINVPFITEACNIMPSMRIQVLGEWDTRKRGRSRHLGGWHTATVETIYSNDDIYGISVEPIASRPGHQNWPLYAAGSGVIVHNTGADNDAVEQIIHDFNCTRLPLTITYRCPKTVVDEARRLVSHIEAHETAPQGEVQSIQGYDFSKKDYLKSLQPTDAVLCRKVKPLVSLAFQLLRNGVACHVEGREIGAGLIRLVNRWKVADLDALRDRLQLYAERETAKLIAKGKEVQAEGVMDRVETILTIMDSDPTPTTVEELRNRIGSMFSDSDGESKRTLTLSTCHKSKGREWNRVFIYGWSDYMPSPWARKHWQQVQERNLQYVAITRSQDKLMFVNNVEVA